MKNDKPQSGKRDKDEVRVWTFTSINPGLRQVLSPAKHDDNGRCIEPPLEANFGGDTGKLGIWRTTKVEEAMAMRDKMRKKTVADFNVTEITADPTDGDLLAEPTEVEDDAASHSVKELRV